VNIALADKRKEMEDTYSYNKATGTLPADRVRLEPRPKYLVEKERKRLKSRSKSPRVVADPPKLVEDPKVRGVSARKSPIMAARFYMRQDLVNKKLIQSKSQRLKNINVNQQKLAAYRAEYRERVNQANARPRPGSPGDPMVQFRKTEGGKSQQDLGYRANSPIIEISQIKRVAKRSLNSRNDFGGSVKSSINSGNSPGLRNEGSKVVGLGHLRASQEARRNSLTVIQEPLEIVGSPGTAAILLSPVTGKGGDTITNDHNRTFDNEHSVEPSDPYQ
jgi:hypothetical protein